MSSAAISSRDDLLDDLFRDDLLDDLFGDLLGNDLVHEFLCCSLDRVVSGRVGELCLERGHVIVTAVGRYFECVSHHLNT